MDARRGHPSGGGSFGAHVYATASDAVLVPPSKSSPALIARSCFFSSDYRKCYRVRVRHGSRIAPSSRERIEHGVSGAERITLGYGHVDTKWRHGHASCASTERMTALLLLASCVLQFLVTGVFARDDPRTDVRAAFARASTPLRPDRPVGGATVGGVDLPGTWAQAARASLDCQGSLLQYEFSLRLLPERAEARRVCVRHHAARPRVDGRNSRAADAR